MLINKFDKKLKESGLKRTFGYHFYFKNYIFDKINLKNKKLLDLGGGNGLASFFAYNEEKTCKCTIVDPFADGSHKQMSLQFEKLSNFFDNAVTLHNDYIDTLPENIKFDLILMHNSINHIGEDIISDIIFMSLGYYASINNKYAYIYVIIIEIFLYFAIKDNLIITLKTLFF